MGWVQECMKSACVDGAREFDRVGEESTPRGASTPAILLLHGSVPIVNSEIIRHADEVVEIGEILDNGDGREEDSLMLINMQMYNYGNP